MVFKIPEKVGRVAHKAHGVIHRCEWCAHCSYLGLVTVGSHDYKMAAAAMLATTVVGTILHWLVALANVSE